MNVSYLLSPHSLSHLIAAVIGWGVSFVPSKYANYDPVGDVF